MLRRMRARCRLPLAVEIECFSSHIRENCSCLCRHKKDLIANAVEEIEVYAMRGKLRAPTLLSSDIIIPRNRIVWSCHVCTRHKDIGIVGDQGPFHISLTLRPGLVEYVYRAVRRSRNMLWRRGNQSRLIHSAFAKMFIQRRFRNGMKWNIERIKGSKSISSLRRGLLKASPST